MNTKKILTILTSVSLMLVGCEDKLVESNLLPAQVGDEIVFGGTSGYGDESRTAYGDKLTGIGGYTEIKWYQGDKVRIYSAEAATSTGSRFCDYDVTGDNVVQAPIYDETGALVNSNNSQVQDGKYEQTHSVSLAKSTDETSGLQWGAGNGEDGMHSFYGVYPSPDLLSGESQATINLNGNILTGTLPSEQSPKTYVSGEEITENGDAYIHYTVHPAMRYAYMVAKSEATPAHGIVSMSFKPIVTAVEITLKNTSMTNSVENEVQISSVTISSTDNTPICGGFTTTIDGSSNKNVITSGGTSVTIPVYSIDESTGGIYPITLGYGDKLTVTAFLLLNDENIVPEGETSTATANTGLDKLNVTVNTPSLTGEIVSKTSTLSTSTNGGILVETKRKNFINDVTVNLGTNTVVTNWMAKLADDTKVVELSIPGAGGAASSEIFEANPESAEQVLSISQLWARGIRCFEIQAKDGNSGSQIVCNNINCGSQTINTVLTSIQTEIKATANGISSGTDYTADDNGTEFAIVIVTYNHSGDVDDARNSSDFQSNISSYIDSWNNSSSNTSKIMRWTGSTTVSEARGKILMVVRSGCLGVDPGWHGLATVNNNAVYMLGWGFLSDQWYARGFGKVQCSSGTLDTYDKSSVNPLTEARPFLASTETIDPSSYGYSYVSGNNKSMGYYTNGTTSITSDFGYYAATATGAHGGLSDYNAWIQEWKRVANGDFTKNSSWNSYNYWWKSSIDEKWDDVIETLNMSMNRGEETYGKANNYTYYINSLCGFFIDNNIALSYYPTLNIQAYSGNYNYNVDGKYQSSVNWRVEGAIIGWFGVDFSVGDNSGRYGTWNENSDAAWGAYYPTAGYAGNIQTFATWMNNKFYQYLKNEVTLTGAPLGIILLDRVSADFNDQPGYYTPQLIISNNFVTSANGLSLQVVNSEVSEARSK